MISIIYDLEETIARYIKGNNKTKKANHTERDIDLTELLREIGKIIIDGYKNLKKFGANTNLAIYIIIIIAMTMGKTNAVKIITINVGGNF